MRKNPKVLLYRPLMDSTAVMRPHWVLLFFPLNQAYQRRCRGSREPEETTGRGQWSAPQISAPSFFLTRTPFFPRSLQTGGPRAATRSHAASVPLPSPIHPPVCCLPHFHTLLLSSTFLCCGGRVSHDLIADTHITVRSAAGLKEMIPTAVLVNYIWFLCSLKVALQGFCSKGNGSVQISIYLYLRCPKKAMSIHFFLIFSSCYLHYVKNSWWLDQ